MKTAATFSELLQAFFTDRLMGQCGASPLTIANYRDAFCLLIAFARRSLKKPAHKLELQDLDAPFIGRFLDYLERERGNSPRSRNVRLAAIHSFFNYVALHEPSAGAIAQRVLAMRSKRCQKKPIDFLTQAESEALLAAPNQSTWSGRRDRMLLLVALQTGLRVSELMPTQTTWVDPELFLEHCCVKVFYTYKDDDIDQGPNRFWFTLNPECSVERPSCGSEFCPHVFDVRELSTWQPPVQPPYCTGENNTAENQAAWERYPFLPRLNSHY